MRQWDFSTEGHQAIACLPLRRVLAAPSAVAQQACSDPACPNSNNLGPLLTWHGVQQEAKMAHLRVRHLDF